jgi:hypothetical protein
MMFQREGCKSIASPSESKLRLELSRAKSSFASLTAGDGSYVQVGGGPGLFVVERRDRDGRHFRARQEPPVTRFDDGVTISFSGSTLAMANSEWFLLDQVVAIFSAFARGETISTVHWQTLDENFARSR